MEQLEGYSDSNCGFGRGGRLGFQKSIGKNVEAM